MKDKNIEKSQSLSDLSTENTTGIMPYLFSQNGGLTGFGKSQTPIGFLQSTENMGAIKSQSVISQLPLHQSVTVSQYELQLPSKEKMKEFLMKENKG